MIQTHAYQRDDRHLCLAGGILGLAEDGPQLAAFLKRQAFDAVLLGIPFEDLEGMRKASDPPASQEFDTDETDELYLQWLGRYGPVKVPPGDLYEAFQYARDQATPVEAIDLGDVGHADVWAKRVGLFELWRNNRRLRKLPAQEPKAADAASFAIEWDQRLFPTKGLRAVQLEREAWMVKRIEHFAERHRRLFALVPLARSAGVATVLQETSNWRPVGLPQAL